MVAPLAFAGAARAAESAAASGSSAGVEKSVVKVFATVRYPDPYKPWTKQAPADVTGTGVVIEGKRILSNGHVVTYASQVQIQANEAGDKISATVEAIAPGMDLAVLKLDDESFFASHPPLPRASALPQIKDAVMAYGYPEGGTTLSITKGIVSRIEFASYGAFVGGLRIQIDAAINPGNSGGPAVSGDKMVGLAFSRLGTADNIGYIIPCEEIDLFLKDIADGHYDGKPGFYDDLQTFENPALRPFLKLDSSAHGIIVRRPDNPDPAYPLKQWDIIAKIGDTPVDNQGMIAIDGGLRVRFVYLVQRLVKNGRLPLTIIREGKELRVDLPVSPERPSLISDLDGQYPPYFVYGPMVFSTATREFVAGVSRSYGRSGASYLAASTGPLVKRMMDRPGFPGERLVVVSSPFFPHKVSTGYGNPMFSVVGSVNGTRIKNLPHLVETLRDATGEFITFEYEGRFGETMVFRRAEMLAATEDILTDNGVRSQGSPDTMMVWNAKKSR